MDRRIFPIRDDIVAFYLRDRILSSGVRDVRFVSGDEMEIGVSSAFLYAGESADAVVSALLFGERFCVYDTGNGDRYWGQSLTDDYVGYIDASSLVPVGVAATHYVSVAGTFIYKNADIKSSPLRRLSLASRVAVREIAGNFAVLQGGGYVYARHLHAMVTDYGSDHVSVALQFLHVPYLWGGRSSLGLDCSSLVQLSLFLCGYRVPRDSDLQERWDGFIGVDDQDLRRGDVVFWSGHVGMMVDETMLLHANAYHMLVVLEPLSAAIDRIGQPSSYRRLKERAVLE